MVTVEGLLEELESSELLDDELLESSPEDDVVESSDDDVVESSDDVV